MECVKDELGVDPSSASVLKHHWLEEAQHAKIDTLELQELVAEMGPETISFGVDEYLLIVNTLDGLLGKQAQMDLASLASLTGRTFSVVEANEIVASQHRGLRQTFLASGMNHPEFQEVVGRIDPLGVQHVALRGEFLDSRKSEEVYRQIFSDAVEMIHITDDCFWIVEANKAEFQKLGYSWSELVGKPVMQIIHADCRATTAKIMHIVRTGQVIGSYETALVSRSGAKIYVCVNVVPRMSNGVFLGVKATLHDITKRKLAEIDREKREKERSLMELQLRQSQKLDAVGTLAAGIAHEINTPTQFVGDNMRFLEESLREIGPILKKARELAEAVRKGTAPAVNADELIASLEAVDAECLADQVPRAIEQSLCGIDKVGEIVQSIRNFAHHEKVGKVQIDLNHAIQNTINIAALEWQSVAELATEFDSDLPPVPCFPAPFNQVVLDVIVNAAHAIADVVGDGVASKGLITVTTRRDGAFVEIRITDTGTGVPEPLRAKIFDPIFTTKEVCNGIGQGLSIAHSVVVNGHGGTIDFETEVGLGSGFTIRLPLTMA